MSSPFNKVSPFTGKDRGAYDLSHAQADTDADRTAIHHTLGTGPLQAAAGNHNHDTRYDAKYQSKAQIFTNDPDYRSDFPNIGSWTWTWSQTIIDGDLITYKGQITLTAGFAGTAFMSLPIPHVTPTATGFSNLIGLAWFLRQGVAYYPAYAYLDLANAGYSRAAFYCTNPYAFITGNNPAVFAATDAISFDVSYYRTPS